MNKVILIGRLTKDAELKYTPGKGAAVSTFTLAIDEGFGDNNKTNFIPIVLWGKVAEGLASYLIKGKQVAVSGRISTRSYDAKDGTKRYVTEVIADMVNGVKLLDRKTSDDNNLNNNVFGGVDFYESITQVDDGDMPF